MSNDHAELKSLQVRLTDVQTKFIDAQARERSARGELNTLEQNRANLTREIDEDIKRAKVKIAASKGDIDLYHSKVRDVQGQIERFKVKEPGLKISEHAILRFLERVNGIDMEQIKASICGGIDPAKIDWKGKGEIPVNGHRLKVMNGVVVTVITKTGERD